MAKTILFDLDGTLIDTEKYFRICWPKALRDFGYEMTDEQALAMRSLGRPFAVEKLKGWFGEDFDYPAVRAHRKKLMEEMISERGLDLKPGCRRLLSWLRENGWTIAIATATDPERSERYLRKIGLREYFTRIVCATEVKEGKPAPDIYLFACEELGEAPGNVYAVEDSPNGVLSAARAGCKVIMVPDLTTADSELSGLLYREAKDLTEIIGILTEDGSV